MEEVSESSLTWAGMGRVRIDFNSEAERIAWGVTNCRCQFTSSGRVVMPGALARAMKKAWCVLELRLFLFMGTAIRVQDV